MESKAASHRKIGDLLIFYLQYTPWGYTIIAEADDMKARYRRTQAPQNPDAAETDAAALSAEGQINNRRKAHYIWKRREKK